MYISEKYKTLYNITVFKKIFSKKKTVSTPRNFLNFERKTNDSYHENLPVLPDG